MKYRLKVDTANGRMLDREFYDLPDFVLIHTAFDCGNERNVEANFSQAVERTDLFFENVGLASECPVRPGIETIKLEINRGVDALELFEEFIVGRNAFAIRVDHHVA